MEYGAHLPLIELDGAPRALGDICGYARRADELGYRYLCANDHLLFSRPWLDGPTALAAALEASGDMTLATTVALPVIRGPAQTAKMLAAVHALSGGRLVAGLGPGSSARDQLRELALPIGSAEQCAERISAYAGAGAERVFVWPLADDLDQLTAFRESVVPLVADR